MLEGMEEIDKNLEEMDKRRIEDHADRMCRPMAPSQFTSFWNLLQQQEEKVAADLSKTRTKTVWGLICDETDACRLKAFIHRNFLHKTNIIRNYVRWRYPHVLLPFEPNIDFSYRSAYSVARAIPQHLNKSSSRFIEAQICFHLSLEEHAAKQLPGHFSAALEHKEKELEEEAKSRRDVDTLDHFTSQEPNYTIQYDDQKFDIDRNLVKQVAMCNLYPKLDSLKIHIPDISVKQFNAFLWELSGVATNLPFVPFSRIVLYLDAPEMEAKCVARFVPFFSTDEIIEHAKNVPFVLPFAYLRIEEYKEDFGRIPSGVNQVMSVDFLKYSARASMFSWESSRVLNYLYKRNAHITKEVFNPKIQQALKATEVDWKRRDSESQVLLLAKKKGSCGYGPERDDRSAETHSVYKDIVIYWDGQKDDWDVRQQKELTQNATQKEIQECIETAATVELNSEKPWAALDPEAVGADRVWVVRTQQGNKPITVYWSKEWKCDLGPKSIE